MKRPPAHRPRIVARILFACLLCALLPLLGIALGRLIAYRSGSGADAAALAQQASAAFAQRGHAELVSHATAIDTRMQAISHTVRNLGRYSEEVLRAPQVYGSFHRQPSSTTVPGQKPAAPAGKGKPAPPKAKGKAPAAKPAAPTPAPATDQGQVVDNKLYYVTAKDGALRKAIDDGDSALFYARRETGATFNLQRVFATATLDPLLKGARQGEPLIGSAFLITDDNMLRTYPYVDTNGWPADRDFTRLAMFAYSHDKANDDGVVWTSPYVSQFSRKWVVACLSGVMLGGRKAAVAGVELKLDLLADEALGFSFGPGSLCWLQDSDGLLLAAQTGGAARLRLIPMAEASLPDEKMPDKKIKAEANVGESEAKDLVAAVQAGGERLSELPGLTPGQFAGEANMNHVPWTLCGVTQSTIVAQLDAARKKDLRAASAALPWQLGLGGLAALVALLIGVFEGRRISQTVVILTQRLRKSVTTQTATPIAIADESELGALAEVCQELVDSAYGAGRHKPVPVEDAFGAPTER